MKILITGAHFTPAIAVIEEFKKQDPLVEIVYVGRGTTQEGDKTKSIESEVLPKLGVKFISIITGRLQRSFTLYTIPSLLKIPVGFAQGFFIILKEKPDVILSFGGYVAIPLVVIGWLFSIPIIVHEQTLVSGLANKISSFFADKIAVSFEGNSFKGGKVVLTGNPIREEIVQISLGVQPACRQAGLVHIGGVSKLPSILVMGGNQGSHSINLLIEACLQKLLKIAHIYHQTGDSKYMDFERLQRLESSKPSGGNYTVRKWFGSDYAEVLQKADLVISRAGINTLTELAYLAKPALVIPIPYLYQDEQVKNAKFFEKLGLTAIINQSNLSSESLFEKVKFMLKNIDSIKEKAKFAKSVVIYDAAKRLVLETLLLAGRV